MKEKIIQILESKVKPMLAIHNGDIKLIDVKNNIAQVQMLGACSGCASSSDTLKEVVLEEIRKEIPEIEDVVAVTLVSEDIIDMARSILNGNRRIT
jgi:Fe-S cluster biogenesis protein NfuA